jgi:hypothetical protein
VTYLIVVEIKGGLGNQMFQYATARRLSVFNRVPLRLDLTWYEENKQRPFGLNKFNVRAEIAAKKDINHFKWNKWHRRVSMYVLRKYIVEKQLEFDPRILRLGGDTYLSGYWQSYKYFQDVEGLIREELTLKHPLNSDVQKMADEMSECNSVSIHIRNWRDDYGKDPRFYNLGPDYYDSSVQQIERLTGEPHFYIFSDERPLRLPISEELFQGTKHHPVTFVTGNKDYEDLRLMSLCKHHIIANSTFSWWGAWLSREKGITIAPSKMTRDGFGVELPREWLLCPAGLKT